MVGAVSESETGSESPTLLGNLTPLLPRSRICCLDPVPASLPPPLADTRSIEGRREEETGTSSSSSSSSYSSGLGGHGDGSDLYWREHARS